MTDDEMHADKGDDWKLAQVMIDVFEEPDDIGDIMIEAMHDRDRFQRERDYWREATLP